MHKEVEVYVDDMIAKSWEREDHLFNLNKLFFLPSREIEAAIEPSEVPFSFWSKIRKALAFFSVREGLKSRQNKGDFVYKEIVDQGSR